MTESQQKSGTPRKSNRAPRQRPKKTRKPSGTETSAAADPVSPAKPELLLLPVGDIDPCRFQTRTFPYANDADDPRLRELSASIRSEGVIQPITVRRQAERFELAAGERRLRAAQLAGLDHIPAILRELDDRQLAEVTAVENLQREDLPPLEQGASVRLLLDQPGWTHADVAHRIGKSIATVSRLAKLADLTPAWRNVVADPDHPASRWGVRHLLAIARLAPAVQDQVLDLYKDRAHWFWSSGVAQINQRLANYTHHLAQAPWSPRDELLLPEAGACIACPHRSSRHPGLFDDDDAVPPAEDDKLPPGDRCLDVACWNRKLRLWLAQREQSLRQKHGAALHCVVGWQERERDDLQNVVPEFDVDRCKKGTPGAVPCVRMGGDGQLGELFWALVTRRAEEEPPKPLRLGDLRRDLARRRRQVLFDRVREELKQAKVPAAERVLALDLGLTGAELYHWQPGSLLACEGAWQRVSDLEEAGIEEAVARLWKRSIKVRLSQRVEALGRFDPEDELPADDGDAGDGDAAQATVATAHLIDEELERLSSVIGLGIAELREAIAIELPEPDDWAGLDDAAQAPPDAPSEGDAEVAAA